MYLRYRSRIWLLRRLAIIAPLAVIVLVLAEPVSLEASLLPLAMTMLVGALGFIVLWLVRNLRVVGKHADEECGELVIVPVLVGLALACHIPMTTVNWQVVDVCSVSMCAVATVMLCFCLAHADARRLEEAKTAD